MERGFDRGLLILEPDADQGKVEKDEKDIAQIHTCD
jgi:hypothetical protein